MDESLRALLDNKVNRYFAAKTPCGKGLIDGVLNGLSPKENSTLVNNNDYFRLSNHPDVLKAQNAFLKSEKTDYMRSGVFLSGNALLTKVRNEFASFLGAGASYIGQSGWVVNSDVLTVLSEVLDCPFYIDFKAHPSLHNGLKHTKNNNKIVFKHNDMVHLYAQIKLNGPGLIIVNSIYGINGSICPLANLVEIANDTGCMTMVDESHSLGLIGKTGSGYVSELGLTHEVDIVTASLSKTFCTRAGLLTCSKKLLTFMMENMPSSIFSSSIQEIELVRLGAMLKVIKGASLKRRKLNYITTKLRNNLVELELANEIANPSMTSPIISIVVGEQEQAIEIRKFFESNNIFGSVLIWPATSKDKSLIRFSLHSELSEQALEHIKLISERYSSGKSASSTAILT